MMNRLSLTQQKLQDLQSRLQAAVNEWWNLQGFLLTHAVGKKDSEFLPRRLKGRQREMERKVQNLLHQVDRILCEEFSRGLFLLQSEDDRHRMAEIRIALRYIQNAYAQEPSLICHLAQWNQRLIQAYSQ